MKANEHIRSTLAVKGERPVQVVSAHAKNGGFITWVDGGPLDCESWPTRTLLGALHLHKSAVEMVRIRAAQDERV